jgi:hypothetical protein
MNDMVQRASTEAVGHAVAISRSMVRNDLRSSSRQRLGSSNG